jgi:ABC-type transport system involved in multi-copper enzyme maturation permease subunit
MSSTTATAPAHAGSKESSPAGVFARAMRSEWKKLWTVRSTYWTLFAALVVMIGYSALASGGVAASLNTMPAPARAGLPSALFFSLSGTQLGQVALAVLGVLVISSEYRTGMIRSSLAAVPQRQTFLAAKLPPFVLVALVTSEIMAFASFFVGQAFFAPHGLAVSLGDPGVLRAVIGAGLYLTATGVFGLASGALVRNVAGSIAIAIAASLILPPLLGILPKGWGHTFSEYFLTNAGLQVKLLHGAPSATSVGPWLGYGIFWAWIAAVLVVAAYLLHRRDA